MVVLAALGVWLAASFAYVPRTASDKHCPTAIVQLVRKPTGEGWQTRTPQPADPEFTPCQCEEKRSAQAQPDGDAGVSYLLDLPSAVMGSPVVANFIPLTTDFTFPSACAPALSSVTRSQPLPPPRTS